MKGILGWAIWRLSYNEHSVAPASRTFAVPPVEGDLVSGTRKSRTFAVPPVEGDMVDGTRVSRTFVVPKDA